MRIKQGQCDKEACQVAGCGFKVGGHAGRLTNFLGVRTGKSWSEKSWSEKKVGQGKGRRGVILLKTYCRSVRFFSNSCTAVV